MQQIPLSQGKIAILDDDDFARVGNVHWCYRAERDGKPGYATRHAKIDGKTKTFYLHREIMNPPPGHEVVFRNHDRLDCRRENLLVLPIKEARRHHRVRRDCQTGHKGVRYNPRPRTWSADIFVKGHMIRLGTFETEAIATRAYDIAMRHFYPELCIAPGQVDRNASGTDEEGAQSQEDSNPTRNPRIIV